MEEIGTNPLPASLEIKLAIAQESRRVADELRAEVGNGVITEVVDNPQVVDKLLEITQLVGATDRLVAAPFVIEGMLVGVFGAAIALAVLAVGSGPVTSTLVQF